MHYVTLIPFRLFPKNLGNLQEFFLVNGSPPAPLQKIARTLMNINIKYQKVFLVCNPEIDEQDRQKGVKNSTTRNQSHFNFEYNF